MQLQQAKPLTVEPRQGGTVPPQRNCRNLQPKLSDSFAKRYAKILMHRDLRKPPRKGLGIFGRHTRGYVEANLTKIGREALMRKSKIPRQRGDWRRSSKKSFNLG